MYIVGIFIVCTRNMLYVCTLYVHSIYIECTRYMCVHCMYIVYTLYVHVICVLCVHYIVCIALYVHCMYMLYVHTLNMKLYAYIYNSLSNKQSLFQVKAGLKDGLGRAFYLRTGIKKEEIQFSNTHVTLVRSLNELKRECILLEIKRVFKGLQPPRLLQFSLVFTY